MRKSCLFLILTFQIILLSSSLAMAQDQPSVSGEDLPVLMPDLPERAAEIRNPVTTDQIRSIIGPDDEGMGLLIDLKDESFYGRIYTGPYPFEAGESDYAYPRYRLVENMEMGKGLLHIDKLFTAKYNANDWPATFPTMSIGYRLELWKAGEDGVPSYFGFYDNVFAFDKTDSGYEKRLTITEGPYVAMVTSDDPTSVVIAWETDEECIGMVYTSEAGCEDDPMSFMPRFSSSELGTDHEVRVKGLKPNTHYVYFILAYDSISASWTTSAVYKFRTAPTAGHDSVKFAFISDSREGVGSGERNYMGCNYYVLSRLAADSYRKEADFFIFGGDLVNGYTSETEDFRLQLKGWKQALAGFWRSKPVYPAMGNHETLLATFDDDSEDGISLDKWPYETDSAEAVFAAEFFNPMNGPEPADPRRPTYKENVYKFQYGNVLAIAFNNNYWWTTNEEVENYGGSPEGYIMGDQLDWIEEALIDAESDSTIKYIVLYAQEPIFPCGGHVADSMWWNGDNNLRAHTYSDGVVSPEPHGMIETRNRFWKAVAGSSKVAAVLAGDEHEYHRLLVDDTTPVGVMAIDDTDGDGVLDQYSPNADFIYPTWQLTAGTAGAPYYAREDTPWEPVILSSQQGYIIFEANDEKISMTFYSLTGQVVDYVDDLMAVKHQ